MRAEDMIHLIVKFVQEIKGNPGCLPFTKKCQGATEHLKGSPVFPDGVFQTKTVNQLGCPCKWYSTPV